MSDTVLYFSPHFDDVVFSCPLNLIRESGNGREAIVVTFFTRGDQSKTSREIYAARNEENDEALSLTGVTGHSVGLIDAPCRDPGFKTLPQIVLSDSNADPKALALVKKEIATLINHYNPVEIIAPFGIGSHIDHLLIHEAATELKGNAPPIRFYEDYPYAAVAGALQLRLAQQGIALPDQVHKVNWQDFKSSFLSAKYVDRYLEAKDQAAVIKELELRWRNPSMITQQLRCDELSDCSEAESSQATRAANAYRSQLNDFLDINWRPGRERLWKFR